MEGTAAAPAAPAAPTNGATQQAQAPSQEPAEQKEAQPTQQQKEEWAYEDELNVRGKKEKVRLSKEEIRRELQVSKDLQRKASELAKREREWAQREELAKKGDVPAALAALGVPEEAFVEYAVQQLTERAKLEAMSEEQRQAHQAQTEAQRLKAQLEQLQAEKAKAEEEGQRRLHIERNKAEFAEAMELGGLPKTAETLYWMADTQELRRRAGLPRLAPAELAKETHQRLSKNLAGVAGKLEGDALLAAIGDGLALRIAKALADRVTKKQSPASAPSQAAPPRGPSPEPSKWINESEAEARWAALKRQFK